jgi:hypothetical protein
MYYTNNSVGQPWKTILPFLAGALDTWSHGIITFLN